MSLIDINVAIETLRNNIEYAPASLPGTDHHGLTEPSSITKDPATRKKEALNAMKTISDYIVMRSTASAAGVDRGGVSSTDLQLSVHSILQACGDSSPDIRLAGTDHLNKMIRSVVHTHAERILVVLFKSMKMSNRLSQREALKQFASLARHMKPQKCRTFANYVVPLLQNMFSVADPTIMAVMGDCMGKILRILGFYITEDESQSWIKVIFSTLGHESPDARRNAAQSIAHMCHYIPKCHIDKVFLDIHDITHGILHVSVHDNGSEMVECTNANLLQGCVQAYIHMIDVLRIIGNMSSKAAADLISLYQLFTNLICDLMIVCLSVNDQAILSPSLELLSRLLSLFGDQCINWRKEKVNALLGKLFLMLESTKLITVKSYIIEVLSKLCQVFTSLFVDHMIDNSISFGDICLLLHDVDYLIRGKSSIWLATMVQQCILKNVDVRQISHHNHTKKGSDSDDDITRISVALHPHDYKDNVIVVSIVEKSQQIASETEPLRKANDKWQLLDESARTEECLNTRTISSLMRLILYRAQHEESSLCLRMVCTACSLILPACMNVLELCPLVPAQLLTLIYIDDSFWGVKMELLELLERIDYTLLEYYEAHNGLGSQSICELIVNDVIWKYIEDEEPRVREKACATLITILPQLNLRGSDFSSEGIKRSAWDSQYSSMLQRQIISKKIHYDVCRAYFRDHEIENVSILMRQCLARLELVEDDKSRLQGLLSLLNGLSKKYGPFDETQTSLVNYNKGLGCIVGTQVLSHHCVEAIQKMLDIIRFHDASTDLLLHSILVENIGLYVIQFEHLSESNMQLVYSMTNLLLRYLFTMFNAISDLIEYSRSGKVQAEFNAEQYFSSTQHRQTNEEQQQTDIVGEDTSIFFTLTVFERFCTNVKRSLASGATTTDKKDALTCLMNSLLQTLYFVILFGDRAHITVHTVKIMDYLRRFLGDYKYGAILCLQEMFVTLFGKKSTYYSEHTVSNLPPIKIDDVSSELFGKLFIEGRRIVTMNRYASRSIARTSFLQTNSQRNPLALRNRVGDHSMAYLLDLFEPMVIRLKRTFRHTHSHRIHNLILFMLSRMVLTGVDFRRLDKDHSFLNYVLKLLDEMHLYMPEGTEMQNTGLYQIMDFLSILLFSVKYHSRELNHQNLLTTISDNISMSSWSATYILQSLGPMLIRSVTGNVSATEKPPVISAFATQLLEIVLRHINYVECVQVISTLLRATRTKDIELWKSLSGLVRDKIAHGISFGFIVSWSHLCREIDEVFSLFDLLHLDLSSNGGQQHNQIALDSMKSLYPPVLEVLEQWRSTMTTTTTTDLSNGAERPSTLHLSISEDMLLKLLFLMRWMNHRNSRAESMELKLQKLEMFLDASLCGMIVLSHSPNMSNTKEQLRMMLCRMLTETIHLLTTINSIHSACASDAKLSRQKATIRDFMILLDSTKLNPDSVDIFLFSTVLSLATNFAFIHEPFSVEMTNYCLLRLRRPHAALSHVDALQLHAHYFTIAFLVSEVKNVSKILERSKHELNDVFWRFAMQTHGHETITSDMVKRLRDMGEELTIGRHYESLLTVIRSSLDTLLNGDNRQNSFMGIRHVTEFIARLPEVAGLYDIIQHARNKCQYGAQRRLFDTLKDQWNLELASNGENERCTIGISFIDEKWRNIYETSDDCGMIESLLQRQNDCIYRNYKFAPRVLAQLSSNMLREYLQDNFSTIDLTILSKIIKIVGCDDRYMSVIVEFIVNHMQLLIHQKEFAQEQNMLNSDGQWFVLGHVIADILLVYSNSSNARSFPKWAENSIATIIEFHGSLSNLLYGHISNATNTPGDIAILLKFTAGVLFLLEMVRTACPVDSFDTFMRRACSLIIHATSKKRIDMTDCNAIGAVEEDVESIVQRVVSRVYPPIAAIHSAEGPVELKSLLGNRIPFIFEEHLPMLFEMHLSVARLHLDETYASCMTEEYRFHFDHAQIVRLMRQIEEIGCSESVFYRIWDLTFDVFQAVCMGDQHDDLPIVSLKLLTKLLCMMRLKDPKHLQQSQRSPRRPASGVPHKRNTSSIRRVSPTLKNLLRTLDEYLLTGRAAAHLFSYPQDAARSSRRQMRIEIDEILGRAIFSSFFKFVEDAIHKHKQSNLSFVSELVKSLNLIMFRNPKLFVPMTTEVALETSLQDSPKSESIIASPSPSSASSTATDGLTTSGVYGTQLTTSFMQVKNLYQDWAHQPQNQQLPSKLDFNHVFTIYRNLYLNDTLEDDWVLKQHLGTGMCKSFGSLPSNAREQHSALVLKMLKESLRDEHLRLQSYSGIISLIQSGQHSIIAKLIPFLSEHIQTIILSERIVHSQIIVIHMITSVIQYFPDASVHDLTRKAMEAMFSLSDRGTTPLQIVDHIYSALRHLLANYALSDFERKLIEALTSIKKPSMKETQDHRRSITLSSPLSSGTLQPQDMIRTMTPDKTRMASPHTQRRMTLTSLLGFKKSPSTSKSSSQHETSPGLMGSVTSSPSKSSRTSTASQASKAEARKTQLRQGLIQRQQEKDLIVSNPHARQMLLLSLMITSMYSSLDMIEIKASTTEDATGSASNIRERCKMNVLQLFQDLEYRTETRREAEVLLRFLPQLLEDFFDAEQILPLIYGDFLGTKPNPLMLSLVLNVRIPAMFGTTALDTYGVSGTVIGGHEKDEKRRQTLQSFTDWIKLSLNSLSLKRPIVYAEWSMLCLFITTCACRNHQHEALFAEFGCSLPPLDSSDQPLFREAFLRYGLLFYGFFNVEKNVFLANEDGVAVQKELVKVLENMQEEGSSLARDLLSALNDM